MLVIGIDPGKTGALAVIKHEPKEVPVVYAVYDTPLFDGNYDIFEMYRLVSNFVGLTTAHFIIEKVHSMPGQGVASMFNFGMGYGIWQGIIASTGCPLTYVAPQTWKKALMEGMKEKDDARLRVKELFPKACDLVYRKKDTGRADAILIAEYGRRQLYGTQI